jgi:hypothetical protein
MAVLSVDWQAAYRLPKIASRAKSQAQQARKHPQTQEKSPPGAL